MRHGAPRFVPIPLTVSLVWLPCSRVSTGREAAKNKTKRDDSGSPTWRSCPSVGEEGRGGPRSGGGTKGLSNERPEGRSLQATDFGRQTAMGKIIGIDLGTTNSVVAIMEGREPKV